MRPAGRRTVLVVDDEPEIRLLLQRALEKHGFAVETAADGAEAIAKAEALVPGPGAARRDAPQGARLRGLPAA